MNQQKNELIKAEEIVTDTITRKESSAFLNAVFLGLLGEFPGGSTISSIINWRSNKMQEKQLDSRLYSISVELHTFKNEIENKVARILDERLVLPQMHLFGLALESGKYYFNQVEMRNFFANLIAKLFDVEMYNILHPAFIEIIKQLSPLDAKLLTEFRPKTPQRFGASLSIERFDEKDGKQIKVDEFGNEINENAEELKPFVLADDNSQLIGYSFPQADKPLVSYHIRDNIDGSVKFLQDNVIQTDVISDVSMISASVTNLARLGLIELDYVASVKAINGDTNVYNCFLEKPLLPDWQASLVHPLLRKIQFAGETADYSAVLENKKLELKKGVARLTQFGFNFISACVIEAEFEKL